MAASKAFMNPTLVSTASYSDKRLSRYTWLWALYQNTAYDNLNSYISAMGYAPGSALYKYTKGLRNPIGRYVTFYTSNVWGGVLNMNAGDGHDAPSAVPIVVGDGVDTDALRPAIAKIWQWSNFNTTRQLGTMYSTALGDLVIRVADRPQSGKVYLQFVKPSHLTECEWDEFGFVKRAVFEWPAKDNDGEHIRKEIFEHPSVAGTTGCQVQTFRDGDPYGYDGGDAVYVLPYDFVPVVTAQWMNVGEEWGQVGYIVSLKKIDAANSIATQLGAQIGKKLNSPLAIFGARAKDLTAETDETKTPMFFFPDSSSRVDQLVSDLNLADALAVLDAQMKEIEADLPELRMNEAMRSGMSGEALGRAFADVMARIQAVRANHDSALVRALQMAIAIAGQSRYDKVFNAYNLNSYKAGALDFHIGDRPVLPQDSDHELEVDAKRWQMFRDAITAYDMDGNGLPIEAAAREILGWNDDKVAEYLRKPNEDVIPNGER